MPTSKRRLLPGVLSAVSILASCTAGAPPIAAPRLIPPAYLTAPPPAEIPMPPDNPTWTDLVENHIETAGMYHALRERFLGLVRWLETTEKER